MGPLQRGWGLYMNLSCGQTDMTENITFATQLAGGSKQEGRVTSCFTT